MQIEPTTLPIPCHLRPCICNKMACGNADNAAACLTSGKQKNIFIYMTSLHEERRMDEQLCLSVCLFACLKSSTAETILIKFSTVVYCPKFELLHFSVIPAR
jgi:hypothetical protein